MPYELAVDHPDIGEQDIYIHGLGTFRNGGKYQISDEQEANFRAVNTTMVAPEPPDVKGLSEEAAAEVLSGATYAARAVPGPGLMEAAVAMHGVKVTDLTTGDISPPQPKPLGDGKRLEASPTGVLSPVPSSKDSTSKKGGE